MARITEEIIEIKLSELVKNGESDKTTYVDTELLATIETVVQELVPAGILVEVTSRG